MIFDFSGAIDKVVEALAKKYPDVPRDELQTQIEEGVHERVREMEGPLEGPSTLAEQLEEYKNVGAWGVSLLSSRDSTTCEVCYEADGDMYAIDHAIQMQPLPHEECTCEGGCACTYLPKLDDPRE